MDDPLSHSPPPEDPHADNPYRSPATEPPPEPHTPEPQQSLDPQPIPHGTVKSYLGPSIFCLMCCGGVLAIPAIIYGLQVEHRLSIGDYDGAVAASQKAKDYYTFAMSVSFAFCGIGAITQLLLKLANN